MLAMILDRIDSPEKLKRLSPAELTGLADEIRGFLIDNVSSTGGHLSSNLGVVELTLALHRVFRSPRDRIVFDVGHQCYTHKLLTGRREGFATLRKENGMSGFPNPAESRHDPIKAGHGSASISAAVGMARAKKLKKEPGHVIAVIGDGAFTGGMALEAVNNIDRLDNLIIILNDNTMSISKNVGGMARYFTKLRTSPGYAKAKSEVKHMLEGTPVIGRGVSRSIHTAKDMVRRTIYRTTMFEEFGFLYAGPVDGHDLRELCMVLENIRSSEKPVLLHVETQKGRGFRPAELNPGAFHGVSAFNAKDIKDPDLPPGESFSTVFGQTLASEGKRDSSICAVTAAMKYGTGLNFFKKQQPERFFDVGMAEEHAVTFSAGLAQGGMKPVVAIYSTFLQRAYDQIIHDVMLGKVDVLFAVDRAGLVPGDGETHQGIYDAACFSQQSELPVFSPANYAELRHWLRHLLRNETGPRAIRYPRGGQDERLAGKPCSGSRFDCLYRGEGAATALVSYGAEAAEVLEAARLLDEAGHPADAWQLVQINPLPEGLIEALAGYERILFAEEGVRGGGIGEHLAVRLAEAGYCGRFEIVALPETGIDHASVEQLRRRYGLDADALAKRLRAEAP